MNALAFFLPYAAAAVSLSLIAVGIYRLIDRPRQ